MKNSTFNFIFDFFFGEHLWSRAKSSVTYLCDGQCIVEVTERVKLPLLSLHSHEELFDAFKGQLIALDQDADGVGHELGRHLQDLVRQGGGQQHHLR